MAKNHIKTIFEKNRNGQRTGIYSVCSANALVLRAAIRHAAVNNYPLIIESTSNQVNQFGGYTGILPHEFAALVRKIAQEENFIDEGLVQTNLILGGDHLGPLPWQNEPESSAMEKAAEMVRAYTLSGFSKIHLDTSMKLADDPIGQLDPRVCARRGAILAKVVYSALDSMPHKTMRPALIIGSEVPIPGGSQVHEDGVTPTDAEDFLEQVSIFREEFGKAGIDFSDVVGFVVQPGVEFGDDFVCHYDAEKAAPLTNALKKTPGIVFEGHSTDYQNPQNLSAMVRDGIAILKVGPALTFALREGLFLLEAVEELLAQFHSVLPFAARSNLKKTLLDEMKKSKRHWEKYYTGSPEQIEYKMLYSYSDRCRYYLPEKKVNEAIDLLLKNVSAVSPELLSQFFPAQYRRCMAGKLPNDTLSVLCDRIGDVCADYAAACGIGD
jgi:D-tagatose-1,6-bisphosphate aldolase subunit GatZ/KbaZ